MNIPFLCANITRYPLFSTKNNEMSQTNLHHCEIIFSISSAAPRKPVKKKPPYHHQINRLEEDKIKNCDAEYARRHLTKTQPSLCNEGVLSLGPDNC